MVKGVGVESMQSKVGPKAVMRALNPFCRLDSFSLSAEASPQRRTLTPPSTE